MSKKLLHFVTLGIVCHIVHGGILGKFIDMIPSLLKVEDFNELKDIVSRNKLGAYRDIPLRNTSVSKLVSFNLYTRRNPKKGYRLKIGNLMNVRKSPLNTEMPTKVIIHGWLDNLERIWIQDMRDVYLRVADYNVIVVDWSLLAWKEYFYIAAPSSRSVGHEVGRLLNYLRSEMSLSFSKVHLIGYSLGGQIAGFAGSFLSGKIGRITALDPAGPAFEVPILKKEGKRLDPSDAIFVDVIHTGGGGFGFEKPLGHVDFFPNGGVARQPGCSVLNSVYCSHHRAPEFMVESIKDRQSFVARKCTDWKTWKQGKCRNERKAFMGEYASPDLRGSYFLKTE